MRITKRYHRGNDDRSENFYLTAIFRLRLDVDLSECGFDPENQCTGEASVYLDVDIRSPLGKGNGLANAVAWSAVFGLYFPNIDGKYTVFKTKGTRKSKDQWHVGARILLGKIPCKGGKLTSKDNGSVVIGSDNLKAAKDKRFGAASIVEYDVEIEKSEEECGTENLVKADFNMTQGEKAFVLDVGDGKKRNGKLLKEVKEGDKPPFPTKTMAEDKKIKSAKDWKDSKARGKLEVGKNGQILSKK